MFFSIFFQSLENFHWGRICFCKLQVKLVFWKIRFLPLIGQIQLSMVSIPWFISPFFLPSFLGFCLFVLLALFCFCFWFLFVCFCLQELQTVLQWGLKTLQHYDFLGEPVLKDSSRQNSSFVFKLCIQKVVTMWYDMHGD